MVSRRDVCYLLARAFNGWLHFCHATYQPATLESVDAQREAHRILQLRSGESPASQRVKERCRGAGNFGSWGLSWGLVMGRSLKGMVGPRPPLPLCIVSFLCKSILPSISLQNILCECICGMWMQVTHVCMCMSTCKSSCALYGGKRLLPGVFLNCFPYLLRKGLSLNLECPNLSNLVSYLASGNPLPLQSFWGCSQVCMTFMWDEGSKLASMMSERVIVHTAVFHPLHPAAFHYTPPLVGLFTVRGSLLTQRDPQLTCSDQTVQRATTLCCQELLSCRGWWVFHQSLVYPA